MHCNKKFEDNLSERINILRFPLIVGIVFIHNYGSTVGLSGGEIGVQQAFYEATFLRYYVSQVLARISVPALFLMSGYLFYYGFNWSKNEYLNKIKSRIRTLVVPFLFWNLFVLLMLSIAQSIPFTAIYFSGKNEPISSFEVFDYLNALFGLTCSPIAYQFWFIRDLIVLLVFVPLINLILNKVPYVFLVLIIFVWLFKLWPLNIPSSPAICFFYIGALFGFKRYNLCEIDKVGKVIIVAYVVLSLSDILTKGIWLNYYVHKIGILCGIGCAFYLTKYALNSDKIRRFFRNLAPASFFVFATHEPLLKVIRKLSYEIVNPDTNLDINILYFANPVIVITICVITYSICSNVLPFPTKIVTGGR